MTMKIDPVARMIAAQEDMEMASDRRAYILAVSRFQTWAKAVRDMICEPGDDYAIWAKTKNPRKSEGLYVS